jgi:hypothetical protein
MFCSPYCATRTTFSLLSSSANAQAQLANHIIPLMEDSKAPAIPLVAGIARLQQRPIP